MSTRSLSTTARAYLQLVRLPNLFTSMADVTMGFLVTRPGGIHELGEKHIILWAVLLACSGSLYAAGVVLNDVFDLELDLRERPERPLPSGRIPVRSARRLGGLLLAVGTVLGGALTVLAHDPRPAVAALILAACIVLYDAVLKRTLAGPITMGGCRALNVLLGASLFVGEDAAALGFPAFVWLTAAAVGVYVTGITWMARSEAARSDRRQVLASIAVIIAGIGMLAFVPKLLAEPALVLELQPQRWLYMLILLGVFVAGRCLQAAANPDPRRVQAAVKHCLFSLVVLDAAVTFAATDLSAAFAVLALLIPTMATGLSIRST